MSKGNGQADVSLEEQLKEEQLKEQQLQHEQKLALENELPPADPGDGFQEKNASGNCRERVGEAAGRAQRSV